MKYKLEESVSKEDLLNLGFSCDEEPYYFYGLIGFCILIDFETKSVEVNENDEVLKYLVDKKYIKGVN